MCKKHSKRRAWRRDRVQGRPNDLLWSPSETVDLAADHDDDAFMETADSSCSEFREYLPISRRAGDDDVTPDITSFVYSRLRVVSTFHFVASFDITFPCVPDIFSPVTLITVQCVDDALWGSDVPRLGERMSHLPNPQYDSLLDKSMLPPRWTFDLICQEGESASVKQIDKPLTDDFLQLQITRDKHCEVGLITKSSYIVS